MKHKGLQLEQKKGRAGFFFILPWFVGFLLFFLYPVVHSFAMSLNQIDLQVGGYAMQFAGLGKYAYALREDAYFTRHMADTLLDLLINVPIIMVFSFFAAVLLKQKFPGNTAVKVIFFLPVILGSGVFLSYQGSGMGVQSAAIDAAMDEGAEAVQMLQSMNIVHILSNIGLPENVVAYITAPVDRIYSVISLSGVQIFIFLAGLNGISPSIYEACYMEGASGWETFWKITFPMVSPLLLVNFVYSIIDTFVASNNTAMNYITSIAFEKFDFGLSSAMSWIFCLILLAIIGLVSWLVSRRVFYAV